MSKSYFFCGIAGSGMLPLAMIAQAKGFHISGSDRSFDQGVNHAKRDYLLQKGITLHPQDGSGISKDLVGVITSTAVEAQIPDIIQALDKGVPVIHRAAFLAQLFNAAPKRIAVAGTSGKTTVTGMLGYALKELGHDPTAMNGGVFKNYEAHDPFCTALTGGGYVFITEADESDGSIANYSPDIAVLNNVAFDHKPLEELRPLFQDFIAKAGVAVVNIDNAEVQEIMKGYGGKRIAFGFDAEQGDILSAQDLCFAPYGVTARLTYQGQEADLLLKIAGRHNVANAMAAIGVLLAMDIRLAQACDVLSGFQGIKRRMEWVGEKNGITVLDDFGHNPDKIAASLQSLKNFEGRLLVFFQPHGYGFLKLLKDDLAKSFTQYLDEADKLYLVEPYYAGGTVERSVTSQDLAAAMSSLNARVLENREALKAQIIKDAKPQDRIIIMGARDDTLSAFAAEILSGL